MQLSGDRSILHMDLDSFFVSVECLRDSRLKGKPLIIGGKSDRGVVASCSYEARKFGVHSAMPIRLAKRLCPQALIISGDMEAYSKYSKDVTSVISEKAPVFEKSSIDEFYLDLTGFDRFFGCFKWSQELKQQILKDIGLPISFGLSVNKMVSKVATSESKPNGQLEVFKGTEKEFLAPLSISKIPMLGEKTQRLLRSMGIERIKTLREIPLEMMEQLLGKNGIVLWKRANAIDESPVVPYSEPKSISTEMTFEQDTIDVKKMQAILLTMTEKLGFKLRHNQQLTACVAVKIRYSNFDTVTKQVMIPYTSSDHVLAEHVQDLFKKLYDRRLLIRLIGVRLSHLVQGNYQINLFEDTQEDIRLYQAIDRMKRKYGATAIVRANGMGEGRQRPLLTSFMKE